MFSLNVTDAIAVLYVCMHLWFFSSLHCYEPSIAHVARTSVVVVVAGERDVAKLPTEWYAEEDTDTLVYILGIKGQTIMSGTTTLMALAYKKDKTSQSWTCALSFGCRYSKVAYNTEIH